MIPMLASFPISSTQGPVPVSAVAGLQRPLLWVSAVGAIFVALNIVPVVLSHLHAQIWWGAILVILGAVHGIHHRPGKDRG